MTGVVKIRLSLVIRFALTKPEIENSALKELKKLDGRTRKRIINVIESLRHNPRPDSVRKLTDSDSLYRVRVGDYRVIYQIQNKKLLVLVVRIGSRGDVYKNL